MSSSLLTIDQGTTGSQVFTFDTNTCAVKAQSKIEFPQIYPQPGWVEHNPAQIWSSVLQALKIAHDGNSKIEGIGITNQRETCLAWNRETGETAGNALVWQDRRTAAFCDTLRENSTLKANILNKTGLVCDPYFSASKMKWMLENYPNAQKWAKNGTLCLGTIDSYLIFKLTNGKIFATDHTNASRTMLYNLHTGKYDAELLDCFGIPEKALPEIKNSSSLMGETSQVPGLQNGIPILSCIGDQQSALYGGQCLNAGEAKITYGTGAFLLMNIGHKPLFSNDGLLTTVAYSNQNSPRTFALEGSAFIAGAAVQFMRDNFGWIASASQSESCALSQPRDESLIFIPALTGLAAPYWNPKARGTLFGLTRGTHKAQIMRCVLESIAIQNAQLLSLMTKCSGFPLKRVGVDGGASQNNSLMQFQADILRTHLARPANSETTALGAAFAALATMGKNIPQVSASTHKTFTPEMPEQEANKIKVTWLKALECVNQFYS